MELKVRGKDIKVLPKELRVRVKNQSGLGVFFTKDIADQEFDVIAISNHYYDDRSNTPVAIIDTPTGMREIALERLIVIHKS